MRDIKQLMIADIITLRNASNNFTVRFAEKRQMFLSASDHSATTAAFAGGLKKFFRN